ncbi:MAG: fimbria/pilus periplasmic chaperone [Nostoc sp.]|uniref:fimbrial biogenesis chaperone n=1 Tax=Nostoc sp. TaxID=1180 RepID=UPI002FF7C010
MLFFNKKSSLILSLMLSLGLVVIDKAGASNFRVFPIQVAFTSKVSSQVLNVHNESNETLRFQLHTYTWKQNAKGEMQLDATEDIVAFPGLFTLKPGQQRLVRVGTLIPVSPIEKTYRIFIEELPPEKKPNQEPTGISILTKIGIPIFLQPSKQIVEGGMENIVVSKNQINFQVKNTGNVHFITQKIRVQGLGEGDKTVFDRQRNGWYILAGTSQSYDLKISQQECSKTRTLVIEVKTDNKVFTEKREMPKGACSASN